MDSNFYPESRKEQDHKLGGEPRKQKKNKKGKGFSIPRQFMICKIILCGSCIGEMREMKQGYMAKDGRNKYKI